MHHEERGNDANPGLHRDRDRDRRRFVAALGLFLVWVALLIGLGVKSGYRPMDRAGTVPSSVAIPQGDE